MSHANTIMVQVTLWLAPGSMMDTARSALADAAVGMRVTAAIPVDVGTRIDDLPTEHEPCGRRPRR